MKHHLIFKFFACVILLFSTHSQAVIIEGKFNGTVWSYWDDYDDSLWSGYWDKDIFGTSASGSFWYDTEKAPKNLSTSTSVAQYRSLTNEWMDFSFTIGGRTFRVSDLDTSLENDSLLEMITIQDFTLANDASVLERFFLSKNISTYSGVTQRGIRASVEIYDYTETMISDLGLIQDIDWTDEGWPSYGRAYFSMLDYVGSEGIQALGWIEISSFQLKEKGSTNLSEPSLLWLLLSGFMILLIKRVAPKTLSMQALGRDDKLIATYK